MTSKTISVILIVSILGAVQGMFQFGYNTGVLNAPTKIIKEWIANIYQETYHNDAPEEFVNQWLAYIVSAFPVGGMIGALFVPSYCSAFGPKKALLISNIVGISSALIMVLSIHYQLLIGLTLGRALIGFYSALCMALVPLYLSEIAPTNIRGAIGTLSQLAVTVGLFIAQLLGQSYLFGTKERWIWLLIVVFIPSSAQLLLMILSPESPRYLLIIEKKREQSIKALKRLRPEGSDDINKEIDEINAEEEAGKSDNEKYGQITSVMGVFRRKDLHKPLLLGVVLHMSQQLTGINAVFYYSTSIFSSAGFSSEVAAQTTLIVGIIMITMTLVSVPLMDRVGRRTLHLSGLGGMFVFSILLTLSLQLGSKYESMRIINVISVMSFTVSFAIGPGSIPFTMMSELFSHSSRTRAISICVFVNWSCNFLIAITFPIIQPILGSYVFVPSTILLASFWLYLYLNLPETKNRSFDEISALFSNERQQSIRSTSYSSLDGTNRANLELSQRSNQ